MLTVSFGTACILLQFCNCIASASCASANFRVVVNSKPTNFEKLIQLWTNSKVFTSQLDPIWESSILILICNCIVLWCGCGGALCLHHFLDDCRSQKNCKGPCFQVGSPMPLPVMPLSAVDVCISVWIKALPMLLIPGMNGWRWFSFRKGREHSGKGLLHTPKADEKVLIAIDRVVLRFGVRFYFRHKVKFECTPKCQP